MKEREIEDILNRLLEWADHMGGWEAPIWDEVRSLKDSLKPEPEGRIIFETVEDARDEATRKGFEMITAGTNPDRPWIKLSEWDLKMLGSSNPRYLLDGNRLYRITAHYFLGYDHSKGKEFDVQVRASEKDVEAGRFTADITVNPDSPLHGALSEQEEGGADECDDCALGGRENCKGCMD